MKGLASRTDEERALEETLAAFDQGARLLEDAFRELWSARERERGETTFLGSERVRDLCHEIRNPLAGVRGLASLLRRELERLPESRALRILDKIIAGLDGVDLVLRRDASDGAARSDAGVVAEEIAGLALAESEAAGHDIRFRVEAPEGIELPVAASAFRRILSNLVRNAAEACGERGIVTLRVESTLEDVSVTVEDTGRGLPEVPDAELLRRGFSTKGKDRGRGLAVVDDSVREAGGSLELSRRAVGAMARVRLPRRREGTQ